MLEMSFETDLFERDAKKAHLAHAKALPEATRYTLNEMAVQTWKSAKMDLKKTFTIRNTWTARSLGFQKVGSTNDIDRMESYAGSREDYMREQEEGISRSATGKHGEPIPTTHASGDGQARQRKKRIMRKFYLGRLKVAQGLYDRAKREAGSDKQVLPLLVRMAKKQRKKVIFWKSDKRKQGLFQIDGDRLPMIYDLTEKRIVSRPRRWLTAATEETIPKMRNIYGKALFFNLRKYSR